VLATAEAADTFETLMAASNDADLVSRLKGPGSFTVLASTNPAFVTRPAAATVDDLPESKSKLQAVSKYHVLPGPVPSFAAEKRL
jgi:uncharacterized surface protein with fasciclin (FAS1) repeats